jgi:hypothetical protein
MRDVRSVITTTFLALAIGTAAVYPSRADTGPCACSSARRDGVTRTLSTDLTGTGASLG